MTPTMPHSATRVARSRARPALAVGLALGIAAMLGGCTTAMLPDFSQPAPSTAPRTSPTGMDAAEQRAVAACLDRAEAQGFTVSGVSSATDMFGRDGRPSGKNVFVDVSRGGQSFSVRCGYTYATAQAQIMTL